MNIADLRNIKRISSFSAINFAYVLISAGDYFYVSEDSNAMAVYDMSNLENIQFIDTFFATEWSSAMIVIDTILYANQSGTLAMYSVSDPANPYYIGYVPGGIGEYSPLVHCEAPLLYVLRPSTPLSSIVALDISDPANITEFASLSLEGYLREFSVIGDTLLASGSSTDLQILSINDLLNPTIIQTFERNYGVFCFERGGLVYLFSNAYEYGVSGYKITDYQNVEKIFKSNSQYCAYNVSGRNDTLYFKDNLYGYFNIVDFTDTDKPELVKSINDSSNISESYFDNKIMIVSNNLLFTDNSGLVGIDLNDSSYNTIDTLRMSGALDFEISAYSDQIVILSTVNGLRIVDSGDVTDMDVLSSLSSYGTGDIALKDTFIYTGTQNDSLRIFKSRNPLHLEFVKDFMDANMYADGVIQICDTFLYIGSYSNMSNGLAVYSISDPLNPNYLGSFYEDEGDFDFGTYISDMQIVNDTLAYVMKPDFGVVIYDVKNPSNIIKAGYFEMNSYFNWGKYGIFVDEGYIYVSGNYDNLFCLSDTLSINGIKAFGLEKNCGFQIFVKENPFSNSISLNYTLNKTERVTINLHDIQGRIVKRIYDRIQNSGEKQIKADCADIPSGVYFLAGRAGGREFTIKLLKI